MKRYTDVSTSESPTHAFVEAFDGEWVKFDELAQDPAAALQMLWAQHAQEIATLVVQSAAETDPADPTHKDTILINAEDLHALIASRLEDAP